MNSTEWILCWRQLSVVLDGVMCRNGVVSSFSKPFKEDMPHPEGNVLVIFLKLENESDINMRRNEKYYVACRWKCRRRVKQTAKYGAFGNNLSYTDEGKIIIQHWSNTERRHCRQRFGLNSETTLRKSLTSSPFWSDAKVAKGIRLMQMSHTSIRQPISMFVCYRDRRAFPVSVMVQSNSLSALCSIQRIK